MSIDYTSVDVKTETRHLRIRLALKNTSRAIWEKSELFVGWQIYDPETGRFIREGRWTELPQDVPPGGSAPVEVEIDVPPERGGYRFYVSPISQNTGWAYLRGEKFVIVDASVQDGRLMVDQTAVTTRTALRRRALRRAIPLVFRQPFSTLGRNHRLIRSMTRRDILARYRGSFGDVLWTVLNPLLLMATYFFVFGVVLHSRFEGDSSSTGFVLYFLAGMMPWLAFVEPAGRAPQVVIEHRNFVKKLIFPLETLPVNQVVSGFVTELFALGVFLIALLLLRGAIPITVLWLPLVLIPQLLFTLGVCWVLAALGAFLRDLGQIIGFLLTLWFFVTPICYPESSLPKAALSILDKNPIFVLVRDYRAIFLEHSAPALVPNVKLWIVSIVIFLVGHAWFYKLRKSFADVI